MYYKKEVSIPDFVKKVEDAELGLDQRTLHFITTLLDEDYNGSISLEEYYFTLDTYNSRGEVEAPYDGEETFVPFVHRVIYKLIGAMRSRNLSSDDLFRMIDISNDS